MKNNLFALFGLIICILSFCGVAEQSLSAEQPPAEGEKRAELLSLEKFAEPEYYCREALKTLENSEALLYAYDSIVAGVEKSVPEINVFDGIHPISKEEFDCVFDAYRRDRTEHFWLGNTYSISFSGTNVVTFIPSYDISGVELEAARLEFDALVNEILLLVNSDMSEFERELVLHDEISRRVTYTLDAENAYSAYGALAEGASVCEGYAEAFAYLLFKAGIQSFVITGSGVNPSTGVPEAHAWNVVRIDGKYYHVDLTWNDQEKSLFHAYFNLTDLLISEDHILNKTGYPLPSCYSSSAFYFSVKDGDASSYDIEGIGQMLKKSALRAHVYTSGNANTILEWFYANIKDIAAAAGVFGNFTYGYECLGRELVLIINPSAVFDKISLTVDKNMSLNYYVRTDSLENFNSNRLAVRFAFCGESFTVHNYTVKDGEFVFSLNYIFFHYMCESIDAELILTSPDGAVRILSEKKNFSIKEYCTELIEAYSENGYVRGIAESLLIYGAECQRHLNYNSSSLPTDGLDLPSDGLFPSADEAVRISGNDNKSTYIKDIFLIYDELYEGVFKICIDIYSEAIGHAALKLYGCEILSTEDLGNTSEGTRRYTFSAVGVLGTDRSLRVECSAEGVNAEAVFSLNSCIYEILSRGKAAELSDSFLLARYRLGVSADSYAFYTENAR